ncbi:TPA: replication endonuclease [Providencia alcalifaciens]|uniref:replication endonuclease n=1 Tax=Providencia alcalifaciens TaxID=126385 RepID=UPI0003E29E43|nr:replication endonuclease [Providencia alcalifaciens]ETT00175.1 replication protein A family protein [Providencia alcalifaciens PAL-3]MTC14036.1 replication endonuclease [Providencia alcalifaciens]
MTTVSSNTVKKTLYYKASKPIERPFLTYPELHEKEKRAKALAHAETLLSLQPKIVQLTVEKQFDTLLKEKGVERASAYLAKNFHERIYPRIETVTKRYSLTEKNAETYRFFNWFNAIPDMSRKSLESLALELSAFVFTTLSAISENRKDEGDLKIAHMLYTEAAKITQAYRQEPPRLAKLSKRWFNEKDAFIAIAQMTSEKWWLNRLRRHAAEWREHLHIALTNVSKRNSIYASTMAISEWKEQKRRTREFLKSMELEDEEGNRFSLIDKYYGSVANPAIRRTEMMVRIRGFENICNDLGYIAEFYTLTAPSKYHATTIHGHRNRKWNGSSPTDTQRYLSQVWSKVRAKLHRNDLRIFGLRVAEPHHDGTPHWHMLFFMLPEQAESIREILREYAFEEDESELSSDKAKKARFHAEAIDPEKGSATGYVAKYIAKNVDGYALDGELDDESGRPMKEAAMAAAVWSARWRIRQFQFIGGAPVTVYRELRKMADHETAVGLDVEFAVVHDAADSGDWAGYVNAQGGPFVRRDDLIARLWYEESEETNAYGEEIIRVKGVFSPLVGSGSPIITRLKSWKIVKKLDDAIAESAFSDAYASPRSSVNNCTGVLSTVKDKKPVVTDIVRKSKEIGITLDPEKDPYMIHSIARGAIYTENGNSVRFHTNGHIQLIVSKAEKVKKSLSRCELAMSRIQQRIKENGKNGSRAQSSPA